MIRVVFSSWLLVWLAAGPVWAEAVIGPEKGTLVIVGGGAKSEAIPKRFIELAGGNDALIVVVPTAGEADMYDENNGSSKMLRKAGATNLKVLHTRDRAVADSDEFVKEFDGAKGVWFGGGRQWRLADSYLHTRTEAAIKGVLSRGGVVGGSSAGATIQGSYLVRGAVEGNKELMSPGHEEGLGLLKNTAIDQHIIARKREGDLVQVVEKHPELLGIGIDEDTAIVVRGDVFEVIGNSEVAITDPLRKPAADEQAWYLLKAGERFDLKARRKL